MVTFFFSAFYNCIALNKNEFCQPSVNCFLLKLRQITNEKTKTKTKTKTSFNLVRVIPMFTRVSQYLSIFAMKRKVNEIKVSKCKRI